MLAFQGGSVRLAALFCPGMFLGSPGPAPSQGSRSWETHPSPNGDCPEREAWESGASGRGPLRKVPDPAWVSRKASQRR